MDTLATRTPVPSVTVEIQRLQERSRSWTPLNLKRTGVVAFEKARSSVPCLSVFSKVKSRVVSCSASDKMPMPKEAEEFTVTRIHYHRKDNEYENWGLHAWGDTYVQTAWEEPLHASGIDGFGIYWELKIKNNGVINFIVHRGDTKDNFGSVLAGNSDVWVVSECAKVFTEIPQLNLLPKGNLLFSRAFWLSKDLFAWNGNIDKAKYYLFVSRDANLKITAEGVKGEDTVILLEEEHQGLPLKIKEKFPHLANYKALKLPPHVDVRGLIKSQLAVACVDDHGIPVDATGIQLPGVLDDAFSYDGPLGAVFTDDAVNIYIWAPTAQCVTLMLYTRPSDDSPFASIKMKEEHGVWRACGPTDWKGRYYLYEVTVFHFMTQKIERCVVIDPYSRGLSANGERSLLVDLNNADLKPDGWSELVKEKPNLKTFTDISIYELHIRDFSMGDKSVDPSLQGTYLAFTLSDSAGVCHLKKLAQSGLTHLHLLPSFQFASVDDRKENWMTIDEKKLMAEAPDSEVQQAEVTKIQDEDAYNWGYDPVVWGVPKGSYSTEPNGPTRILEFRKMVQAINRIGLRIVLDVVYNHVHASGPHDRYSVLDKVVPGYYLRRNIDGLIENSACVNNTASEHYMVNRVIVDDIILWATEYKVDGFRFDLMGHLMKKTMVNVRSALDRLTVEKDNIDGSTIYIYGEGWDFGEVAHNGRGVNACQNNLMGTSIGSFNDRIRDSILGGSPFGHPRQQGFVTGLYLQPNEHDHGDIDNVARVLGSITDSIHVGLAGNLRDFLFTNQEGKMMKGSELQTFDGSPVGYAANPVETINYVSAHDNETLFDNIMMKVADDVSVEERCRINHLATSMIALSQGIPFFHAGDDMLRSKSLDRDSYNSGDWFNRLDFTYESNNWGVGLPPKSKNEKNWPLIRRLLGNPSLKVSKSHILSAVENFQNLLKIRQSSPLFRLQTTKDIRARVRFHNTGPSSIPGSIIMSIEDGDNGSSGLEQLDPLFRRIVVIFNARPDELAASFTSLKSLRLSLHPVQMVSSDERLKLASYETDSGFFKIPPRTTSVFVEAR
eukprot:TRINITY_DN3386_c0_g2_i1.p1 TRINITY_DN3386_c0_g2~~TRINITY_DN3386_c0_g2_i1.p1  ORF type:complete len:1084 (+),score=223.69 TRINITY_DN3386_c0_g2_i1:71-3253(+)